ncbi:M48 family metallopeptidase [Bombiscardovia coagulans]|uniref:Metal-dependent hydrolase n=1 Tax=Bombiscardovia coagulans TaxID=686666 RepID=A0A261EQY6_9BIFI|nr:SprT family zinc-dependent metalloprotease [Bombiscardovia coagulans]OZG49086.1 metal-dependent hydrolase [Bombiscardovia coagulans]
MSSICCSQVRSGLGAASVAQNEYSRQWVQTNNEQVLVIRKNIRNAYLRVKLPDGHVEVTAPLTMSQEEILHLVRSRWAWVLRMKARISDAQQSLQHDHMSDEKGDNAEERMSQARQIIASQLPELLSKWVPIVGREPSSITLRQMKTRWGSCTPVTGRIRLNVELAWLEPQLLEYVLVHELTHLRASGHGPLFQHLMSSYLPQWKSLRKQLNQHVIV